MFRILIVLAAIDASVDGDVEAQTVYDVNDAAATFVDVAVRGDDGDSKFDSNSLLRMPSCSGFSEVGVSCLLSVSTGIL